MSYRIEEIDSLVNIDRDKIEEVSKILALIHGVELNLTQISSNNTLATNYNKVWKDKGGCHFEFIEDISNSHNTALITCFNSEGKPLDYFAHQLHIHEDLSSNVYTLMINKETDKASSLSIIDEYLEFLANDALKHYRRHLPITKSKIDWTKISNYQVGQKMPTK